MAWVATHGHPGDSALPVWPPDCQTGDSNGHDTKLVVLFFLLVAVVASGCGGTQTGTVQGRVIFKEGTTSRYGSSSILQLRPVGHGSTVVATERVSSTGTYHFTVDAGTYSFNDLTLSPCVGRVIVRSGQTIHHDVICTPAMAVG